MWSADVLLLFCRIRIKVHAHFDVAHALCYQDASCYGDVMYSFFALSYLTPPRLCRY